MRITVRPGQPEDAYQGRRVNELAFGRPHEAALVEAVRGSADTLSLVAVLGPQFVLTEPLADRKRGRHV